MATKKITLNELRSIVKQIIKEALDLRTNDESDFLKKVKNENPEMYVRFVNLIKNRGLDYAKEIYKTYDKEIISNELKSKKKELEKQQYEKKLKSIYKKLKVYWDKQLKDDPDDFDAIQWAIEFYGGEEYMLKQIDQLLKQNKNYFNYLYPY